VVHLARLRGNKNTASSVTPWEGYIEKEIRKPYRMLWDAILGW